MIYAINGNRHQKGHLENIDRLVTMLLREGHDVVMSDRFLEYLVGKLGNRFATGLDYIPLSKQPKADIAISIGGDGAFLKTARWIGDAGTPVAGINTGHLGFLAAYSFERFDEIEKGLVDGKFEIDSRALLQIDGIEEPAATALNEIAFTRTDNASMISVETWINGHKSLTYQGDGLIVATPTGSTAYNLSVGGPILDPGLPGWVIAPIAAHSLSIRPLVVDDSGEITFHVSSRARNFRLIIDGRSITMPTDTRIAIKKAPYRINIIQQPGHAFTDTLRSKLGLGN